jgi:bifunctional non-homologous end joining protein LigD
MPDKSETILVKVENRQLRLSNLSKVLYPQEGVTKGEIIEYYTRVAPVLLPHVTGRPLTTIRFPNGTSGHKFFEKNVPRGAPSWVRTVRLPVPGSTMKRDEIDYIVADDLPTLVWLANLAALELHVPQWRVGPSSTSIPGLPQASTRALRWPPSCAPPCRKTAWRPWSRRPAPKACS